MSLTYRSLSTAPTYRKKSGTSASVGIQNVTLRLASLGVDSQASSTLQSLQRSAAGRGTYTEVPFSLKSIPSVQGAGRAPSVSAGSVNPMNVIDSRLGQDLGKAVKEQFFSNPFDYKPLSGNLEGQKRFFDVSPSGAAGQVLTGVNRLSPAPGASKGY